MTERQCERHPKAMMGGVECPACVQEQGVIFTKGPVYKCAPSDRLIFVDASETDVTVEACSSWVPMVKKTDPSSHVVTVRGPGSIGVSRLERPLDAWPTHGNWVRE